LTTTNGSVKEHGRGAIARDEHSTRKARKFTIAGAAGLAILIGAGQTANADSFPPTPRPATSGKVNNDGSDSPVVSSGVKPMSGPIVKERKAEELSHVDILKNLARTTSVTDAASLAMHTVRIAEAIEIVRSRKPGTANKAIYDEAMKTVGAGSWDKTINGLVDAHMAAIRNLNKLLEKGDTLGTSKDPLLKSLSKIMDGMADMDMAYVKYNNVRKEIAALIRAASGGALKTVPKLGERAKEALPVPIIEMPIRDLGPIHLLKSKQNDTMVAVNADPTPAISSMFGGDVNARAAMLALGNAYATLTNSPNDLAAQQTAAKQLYDALNKIPKDKEIWTRAGFNSAMANLNRGDLRNGLSDLSGETAFNAIYGSLNNLYVISVSNRAVSIMRAGVTVRYEFDKNVDAFEDFIRSARGGKFQPRILYLALGLHYEYLALSGQLKQYQVEPGVGGQPGNVKEISKRPLKGTGNVIGVTPQIGLGASAWGKPMEIVLYANFGYRQWEMGTDIVSQTGAAPTHLSIGEKNAFLGIVGTEVRFPGLRGQKSTVRIGSVGAGIVAGLNPYAFITVEGLWKETNKVRVRSELTPQYSYFLEQHRPGFEVKPAEVTVQLKPGIMLHVGPGFRYNYNHGSKTHTLDGYGRLTLDLEKYGVALDLRGGYLGEVGGAKADRIPNSPYGSFNITLRPGDWKRKRK
jgi:hypothetical protein